MKGAVLMRVAFATHPGQAGIVGQYLRSWDVDAFDGRGRADFTADPAKAHCFESFAAAVAVWNRQSTIRPTRPDGRPNKPLTAYSVEFEQIRPVEVSNDA